MAWSKRKPYYNLKFSMREFFSAAVRHLKDSQSKESFLEKPYRQPDRGAMHMDWPSFQYPPLPKYPPLPSLPPWPPWTSWNPPPWPDIPNLPPWPPWAFPPWPGYPPSPKWPLPNPTDPTQPTGPPGTPDIPGPVEPSTPPVMIDGFWIRSYCDAMGSVPDCAEEGDTYEFTSRVQYYNYTMLENLKWIITSTDPSIQVKFLGARNNEGYFQANVITAPVGPVTICISMSVVKGIGFFQGRYQTRLIEDVCECWELESCDPCPVSPVATWDYDNSIETIGRSTSGTVTVKDGLGPYTWAVSGTGFSIGGGTGASNTLTTDGTACGTATITVTDACGTVVTAYVRCTEASEWSAPLGDTSTLMACGSGACTLDSATATSQWFICIVGKYRSKINTKWLSSGGDNPCSACPSNSSPSCSGYGLTEDGCKACVTDWGTLVGGICSDPYVGSAGDGWGYCCDRVGLDYVECYANYSVENREWVCSP